MLVKFTLNGNPRQAEVDPGAPLSQVLREQMGMTGVKEGCKQGDCGACSILLNGKLVNSCLVLAGKIQGAEILTVEGLSANGLLHPLQQCFLQAGAVQCGYCTPGMLMAAYALLKENPQPSEAEIRQGISGNLCRCTGYVAIVSAIQQAAQLLAADQEVRQ